MLFPRLEHWKTVLNGLDCGERPPLYRTFLIAILFILESEIIL
nr:MAG TPA: hypothetical protein [Microviridae sp.]